MDIAEIKLPLQNQIDEEIASRVINTNSNASEFIVKNLLENLSVQLRRLEKELAVDKYRIAFIGSIGAGKTTAICHLLKLTMERQSDSSIKKKVPKKQTIPLLTTAAGGTTLCEVEIKYADNSFIELEPFDGDRAISTIRNFAEILVSRYTGKPETDPDDGGGIEPMPQELERALRNFTGLQKLRQVVKGDGKIEQQEEDISEPGKDVEKRNSASVTIDKASELYNEYKQKGLADTDFIEEVIRRANIEGRRVSIFNYTKPAENLGFSEINDEKEWVFRTFEKINLGKDENMVLPRRMVLNIPFVEELGKFEAFIDTKGLDSGMPRHNIDSLLNDINTICLFTSIFSQAPEPNIVEFLKRNIRFNSEHHYERHMILVLPRKDEPEKQMTNDGLADDWEIGTAYKRDNIFGRFNDAGIKIPENQIHFYNPLNYYFEGSPVSGYTDLIDEERDEIFSKINELIDNKRMLIRTRIKQVEDDFLLLKDGHLSPEDENRLRDLKSVLLEHKHLNFVASSIIQDMVEKYRVSADTKNARTKHSLNSNDWVHPYRDIDVFNLLHELCIIPAIQENSKKKVSIIKNHLQKIQDKEGSDLFKQVGKQLADIFEFEYQKFVSNSSDLMVHIIRNNVDENFYGSLYREWGRGSGYTTRVSDLVTVQFVRSRIQDKFEDCVNNNWGELITNFSEKLK